MLERRLSEAISATAVDDHRRLGTSREPARRVTLDGRAAGRRQVGTRSAESMDRSFLVPAGRERFELYSEAPEEPDRAAGREDGRFRRWAHARNVQWHELVDAARPRHARRAGSPGGATRSSAASPRRSPSSARSGRSAARRRRRCATRPSSRPSEAARSSSTQALADARRHHLRWLVIDLVAVRRHRSCSSSCRARTLSPTTSPSGWSGTCSRGAARGRRWSVDRVDASSRIAGLAELASLVDVPRADARAARGRDRRAAEPAAAVGVLRSRRRASA